MVRVHSPPAEGAANEAVVELLARTLGVARRDLRIEQGARSRRKIVSAPSAVAGRLADLLRDG